MKIFGWIKKDNRLKKSTNSKINKEPISDIKQTANSVFEEYKKSFKDLALYDRGEKVSGN